MKFQTLIAFLAALRQAEYCLAQPTAHDSSCGVTYQGVCENGIETFLSIPYGQDTGGENRFKPPRPYVPRHGSVFDATKKGPACPQPHGAYAFPLYLSNITSISEDCLHLNVYRAEGTRSNAKLPVMLYVETYQNALIE
jgi:carboxylesterase type B